MSSKNTLKSYITECLIVPRKDEILFHMKENGEMLARLHKYAIVPLEDYERLNQSDMGTIKTRLLSS